MLWPRCADMKVAPNSHTTPAHEFVRCPLPKTPALGSSHPLLFQASPPRSVATLCPLAIVPTWDLLRICPANPPRISPILVAAASPVLGTQLCLTRCPSQDMGPLWGRRCFHRASGSVTPVSASAGRLWPWSRSSRPAHLPASQNFRGVKGASRMCFGVHLEN